MPWGGGNSGSWGSTPWGGDGAPAAPSTPTYPSAVIDQVTVLGNKLLRLDFNVDMKVDGILTDPSNYSIVPQGSGVGVSVDRIITPTGASTDYVMLSVTPFSVGESYTVDIINLRTTRGNSVDVANSASEFYGRVTKLDFAQSTHQKMYNMEPDSVITSILIAIMGEDEKIGGTEGNGE